MKLLTVSLLICVLIALAQAAALRRLRRGRTAIIHPRLPPPPPLRRHRHRAIDHHRNHHHEALGHSGEVQLHDWTAPPPFPGGDHGLYYPGEDYGPHGQDYFPLTTCDPGWKTYSALCLLYVPDKMTWSEAEDFCQKKGGNLVAALKEQFSEEINDVIKDADPQVWVGSCTTIVGHMGSSASTPAYIKKTPGGWECVEDESGKEELPFICSILRM
ncbi:lactose-binding lectin l-2-like [Cheilinus undulatus]|uniref:lactose-binding lectin l-2-like n=1 Tax=Cheilinus undulatus TaxID=241271 RepID=UPI001BD45609|nr:lactose-binding lectin l-2-like [Cheilinus undulatus]